MLHETRPDTPLPPGRPVGILIAAGALAMVGFMLMHPTMHAHDAANFIEGVNRIATRNIIVHGTLMGVIALILLGLWSFAERIGLQPLPIRAGLLAYALGALAHIGAATINGLIVPALAGEYAHASAASVEALTPVLVFCHAANGTLAKVGVIAMSAAALLWSVTLLPRPGVHRTLGAVGAVCGILPLVAVVAGQLPMNVHGFGAFVIVQAVWYLTIAVPLIRNRI